MITSMMLAAALTVPVGLSSAASAVTTPARRAATVATDSAVAEVRPANLERLYQRAVKKVRAKKRFAKAVLLEAEARLGAALVTGPSGITGWRFVFDNQTTEGSRFRTAMITYRQGSGFGKPKGNTEPFLEDRRIAALPVMRLKWAVQLYLGKYPTGFTSLTLRRPLGETVTPALYIFGTPTGSYAAVNTRSGKVRTIS